MPLLSFWRSVALLLLLSVPLCAQEIPLTAPAINPEDVAQTLQQLPAAPSEVPPESATAAATPVPQPSLVPVKATPSSPLPLRPAAAVVPGNESIRALAKRLKLTLPLPAANIVVYKKQRRLELRNGSTLIKSYRVALGANPVGHKVRQGDSRTPEGQFYICTRNSTTSAFHIFLGLSYPALPDANRGVTKKQITPREFQMIRNRLASRSAPLWETRLGGWVGIHGGTGQPVAKRIAQKRKRPDWTAGCIALTDREIEEIHAATRMGTPVLVRP